MYSRNAYKYELLINFFKLIHAIMLKVDKDTDQNILDFIRASIFFLKKFFIKLLSLNLCLYFRFTFY
jgi:hypothetical protein